MSTVCPLREFTVGTGIYYLASSPTRMTSPLVESTKSPPTHQRALTCSSVHNQPLFSYSVCTLHLPVVSHQREGYFSDTKQRDEVKDSILTAVSLQVETFMSVHIVVMLLLSVPFYGKAN